MTLRSARHARLTPGRVRSMTFRLARLGRRGLDEDDVREFCDQVEEELSLLLEERSVLQGEVRRLRGWAHAGNGDRAPGGNRGRPRAVTQGHARAALPPGVAPLSAPVAAPVPVPVSSRLYDPRPVPQPPDVNEQALRVLAQAQQTADRYVSDAHAYSRKVAHQAQRRREKILSEAGARATEMLEHAHQVAIRNSFPPDSRPGHPGAMHSTPPVPWPAPPAHRPTPPAAWPAPAAHRPASPAAWPTPAAHRHTPPGGWPMPPDTRPTPPTTWPATRGTRSRRSGPFAVHATPPAGQPAADADWFAPPTARSWRPEPPPVPSAPSAPPVPPARAGSAPSAPPAALPGRHRSPAPRSAQPEPFPVQPEPFPVQPEPFSAPLEPLSAPLRGSSGPRPGSLPLSAPPGSGSPASDPAWPAPLPAPLDPLSAPIVSGSPEPQADPVIFGEVAARHPGIAQGHRGRHDPGHPGPRHPSSPPGQRAQLPPAQLPPLPPDYSTVVDYPGPAADYHAAPPDSRDPARDDDKYPGHYRDDRGGESRFPF